MEYLFRLVRKSANFDCWFIILGKPFNILSIIDNYKQQKQTLNKNNKFNNEIHPFDIQISK